MADYSQGVPPPPPPMLHTGRIPSFKNNHGENFQNRCAVEPPACVQNAMMTKDKKPFTYTPGGLDLSQIRTPSMARRLNKQQQQMEDGDNSNYQQRPGGVNGGPPAPPPPPPPPQLVINVSKSPKPVAEGERPEIVIPDNPIGMLRKTHSPYHWESEQADQLRQGAVPKFVDPAQQKAQQPRQFSQQPPQQTFPNNSQLQNVQQQHNKSPSTSPIWKPEPKYPNSPPPQNNTPTPPAQTKDLLQRQDSQFNHSPSPWNREPPFSNSSSRQGFSPSVDTQSSNQSVPSMSSPASPWRQEVVESPSRGSPYQNSINQSQRNSPRVEMCSPRVEMCSPQQQPRSPMSPAQGARSPYQEQQNNQQIFNNVNRPIQSPEIVQRTTPQPQQNTAPWRQEPRVQMVRQDPYAQQQQQQQMNQNYVQSPTNVDNPEVRYQTHMTIPVTPRKPKNEIQNNVNATPEIPFSPKIVETPKASLPWIKDDSKSAPQPPWCVRTQESPRVAERETESPVQPPWTNPPQNNTINRQMSQKQDMPGRVVPIQMEVSKNEIVNSGYGQPQMKPNQPRGGQQQPQLRIIIDMNQQGNQQGAPKTNQQPQQQIMRVLQPQVMMMENNSKPQMTSPPPPSATHQPKTRIIPIQMEPPSPGVSSPRVLYHSISQDGYPRQSRSFRVLQTITGTQEDDAMNDMEMNHGFSDL